MIELSLLWLFYFVVVSLRSVGCRSAGARCALLKVLSLFTRSARNAHLYPRGLGADRELGLPSLGFVEEAEALCPQLVEATIDKVGCCRQ